MLETDVSTQVTDPKSRSDDIKDVAHRIRSRVQNALVLFALYWLLALIMDDAPMKDVNGIEVFTNYARGIVFLFGAFFVFRAFCSVLGHFRSLARENRTLLALYSALILALLVGNFYLLRIVEPHWLSYLKD